MSVNETVDRTRSGSRIGRTPVTNSSISSRQCILVTHPGHQISARELYVTSRLRCVSTDTYRAQPARTVARLDGLSESALGSGEGRRDVGPHRGPHESIDHAGTRGISGEPEGVCRAHWVRARSGEIELSVPG